MKNINRRSFIQTGAKGVAGAVAVSGGLANLSFLPAGNATIDEVDLGKTGLKVPRLAFGTGSFGWKKTSNQKKLGEDAFVTLAKHGYDRGVRFFETADMYGTHEFVGKALKKVPRENVTVLSKIMVYQHQDWYTPEPFQKSIDRFRKELDTDYIDILLLHCMVNSEWPDEYKRYMDDFSEAKEKGIVKRIGLSCHDYGALKVAAESDWADVVQARINHNGARMDGTPVEIMKILNTAQNNGKGVVGMKIFGCGELVEEAEREKSLKYVLKSNSVDCMTIGFESIEQMDDTIERISRIVHS
ncbi:aldo/keto reductase [Maribellus maritimus]|uniref:aldo/keto reductase n=1 Tax=Maribellus maritimus TaxID=2870838 RepID=UPI001EEBC867|nr:aldo/keto reductase [Maribellus maritimus]MCG6190913.1 aldo/keto reductase [Maribellus maritimus]